MRDGEARIGRTRRRVTAVATRDASPAWKARTGELAAAGLALGVYQALHGLGMA